MVRAKMSLDFMLLVVSQFMMYLLFWFKNESLHLSANYLEYFLKYRNKRKSCCTLFAGVGLNSVLKSFLFIGRMKSKLMRGALLI